MARWTVSEITTVPRVSASGPDDPAWYPLQHALGIDTFGLNLFVATRAEQTLVEEHEEGESGQQEVYLVLEGEALFELDGEQLPLHRGMVVAVIEPSVRRSAKAVRPGTRLLVVGAAASPFVSTWNPSHFSDIRRPN